MCYARFSPTQPLLMRAGAGALWEDPSHRDTLPEFEHYPRWCLGAKGSALEASIPAWANRLPIPHLQGCEQKSRRWASCVERVHHVTDQVDLSSQVLDSGINSPPPTTMRGKRDPSGQAPSSWEGALAQWLDT